MTVRPPHLRSLLLASVLALVAVGCGVETSSDGASPANTVVADDGSSDAGNDDAAEASPDAAPATEPEESTDDTTADAPEEPDAPEAPDDVTVPSTPGGFDEDTFKESLASGFQSAGLTEEQANCVADGYVEEFGTDTSTASDYTAMLDLFESCDVNLMDLGN